MPLTPYIKTTQIIRALDDEPNDVGGLTADQLKAKFDLFADDMVDYINNDHIPEVEGIQTTANTANGTANTANTLANTINLRMYMEV